MDDQNSMQNHMMMKEMQTHHTLMYTFDILVLIGIGTMIVLLTKILKAHRR